MNYEPSADGQPPIPTPQTPSRPIDMTVPSRPVAPLPAAQPRPALDTSGFRTAVPPHRRTGMVPPQSAYPQPPVQPAPYAAPVQPAVSPPPAPRPVPSQAPQAAPLINDYRPSPTTQGRPTAPTTYSAEAMLPGQTPEQYRNYLQSRETAKQQHIAETEDILQRIPPPIEVPPKPVNSKPSFGAKRLASARKIIKTTGSIAVFLGLVWGGAALLNTFVFQSYYVDGLSMTPALSNNDRLIISKVERTKAEIESDPYIPERGQIVVIDGKVSEYTNERHEQLIKRVIGLPGDTVIIQNGIVMIKNKQNPDGFNVDKVLNLDVAPTFTEEPMIVTVPEDHVFVMGDNRASGGSFDSRAFGVVPSEDLLGRLWARILPTDKMSVF